MRKLAFLALLFAFSSALAEHPDGHPINDETALRQWCEFESHTYFIARGITPYNWTASAWSEVNTLKVKGGWRVDDRNVVVECSIERGAPAHYAIMSIH